ncbi:Ig-like domain-containing protein, partial [Moraxella sp. VT-16-12]|uniref:Ig-like domain-containing protein n=1 Tax=Moraxella sp. VT-16-12 TaxID=2014877 RepID=UPI0011B842C6
MQQIIVKTNNASQVVNQTQVVTKNGQPTIIKANGNANYEFVKENTGRAPDHIVTKRVGKDLHVSFEEAGQDSDLIIENFYNYQESALVGQAENGQYYYYIPDTGEVVDYVTQLNAGSIQGQALGGQNLVSPWWVASGLTSTGGLGSLPWLLGSTGAVAAVAHRQGKDDDERPAAYISIETVAKNDVVNVDERGTEVEVIGAVSGYYTPGDIVTLVINGKTYKTPVDATGSFTIKVPAEELSKDSDSIIEASVAATSPAGNFTASTMHRYAVEIVSPKAIHDPANQGGVIVRPDDQADRLIIDYTDEADQPQQITISKDPSTGTWSPQGNLPAGVEVNPQTGEVTLSPDAIKDGSTLT